MEKIDTFCGSNLPKPIMSNGPRLNLEFRSFQAAKYVRGFKASYSFTEGRYLYLQMFIYMCHFIGMRIFLQILVSKLDFSSLNTHVPSFTIVMYQKLEFSIVRIIQVFTQETPSATITLMHAITKKFIFIFIILMWRVFFRKQLI